jgi:hypothetical protein
MAAWLFAGLLTLTRLYYGILIPITLALCALSAVMHRQSWRQSIAVRLIPPALILGLVGWINNLKFGSPFLTGYHQWQPDQHSFTGSWLDGAWGMLFATHWSIFIYFPILFLALPYVRRFSAEHRFDAVVLFGTFLLCWLTLGLIPSWRGEWTYGPRYMLFILPTLGLPALYFGEIPPRRRAAGDFLALAAVAGLLCLAVWMQFEVIGADFWFFYKVEDPLEGRMDKEVAETLFDHHESFIRYDLETHRANLDQTWLFRRIRQRHRMTPAELDQYRQTVLNALDDTNFYWFPPPPPPHPAGSLTSP